MLLTSFEFFFTLSIFCKIVRKTRKGKIIGLANCTRACCAHAKGSSVASKLVSIFVGLTTRKGFAMFSKIVCRVVKPGLSRLSTSTQHIVKSEYPDVRIPQDIAVPAFIWNENASKFGDRTALVRRNGIVKNCADVLSLG